MEFNKDLLIKICIVLIIIILLRFLYIRLTNNGLNSKIKLNTNTIESFEINNGNAIDLLSKLKHNAIIPLDLKNLGNTVIKPWTTKIYNMQTGNQQIKPLALYQPKLDIRDNQYCKLGDMLCQNSDYSPPSSSHFTLLIKKGSSDIKPPINYDLIVNFGEENVNTNYYDYESYITSAASQAEIYAILPNIINCSKIFSNINSLIKNNIGSLESNLSDEITNQINITVDGKSYNILGLINNNNVMTIPIPPVNNKETKSTSPSTNSFVLPAGMNGIFVANQYGLNVSNTSTPVKIPFNIPSVIDSTQSTDKKKIASYIPTSTFKNINENNISITPSTNLLNKLLPVNSMINLIESLCNDISTIYDKHINNPKFLIYLNLVDDIQKINLIMASIDECNTFLSQYDNINSITINTNPEIETYITSILSINCGNSIIGQALHILNNMSLSYNLSYVTFTLANVPIPGYINGKKEAFTDTSIDTNTNTDTIHEPFKNMIEPFALWYEKIPNAIAGTRYGVDDDVVTYQVIDTLTLTSFDNNFVSNLKKNALNVNLNPAFSTIIKSSMKNITDFTVFLNDLQNNTIKNLPLKIYKPIPPNGYLSLGHIFCNLQIQLNDIKINDEAGNGVCCVPENCVKEVRDWNISDKMFEYNKNGKYWALYYNPYTGTFISTNTNNFPDGKVSKVIACVKKCSAVDELAKADDCIRNYYNMNKKHSVKLSPDLVADTEEEYYLDKVKVQSDTITKLFKRANSMQLDMDKATIVNSEMNKNKLQKYVDTQKRNIDIVTKRLIDDDDKIDTNINIPIDVLNALLNMIKNNKKLTQNQKDDLTDKLLDNKKMADSGIITKGDYDKNLRKIMTNCPDYDLSGLVKKDVVSSVCYGCPA